jgi:hypothetical protein
VWKNCLKCNIVLIIVLLDGCPHGNLIVAMDILKFQVNDRQGFDLYNYTCGNCLSVLPVWCVISTGFLGPGALSKQGQKLSP